MRSSSRTSVAVSPKQQWDLMVVATVRKVRAYMSRPSPQGARTGRARRKGVEGFGGPVAESWGGPVLHIFEGVWRIGVSVSFEVGRCGN